MNEDAPSVTVHPLMWADDPEHPDDDYLAAVFTTEQGLRDYVADVALQGVTIVGAGADPDLHRRCERGNSRARRDRRWSASSAETSLRLGLLS